MANCCALEIHLRGKEADLLKFYKAINQNGNYYMGRGASVDIVDKSRGYLVLRGECKWSAEAALCENAISMRTKPEMWYFGEGVDPSKIEFLTLEEACNKWGVTVEIYSEEPGCCFAEHIFYSPKEKYAQYNVNECTEYGEFCSDCYETREEADEAAEEALGRPLTDEEWENQEYISYGGFGDANGEQTWII